MKYLHQKREEAGGYLPQRKDRSERMQVPDKTIFESFFKGSGKEAWPPRKTSQREPKDSSLDFL